MSVTSTFAKIPWVLALMLLILTQTCGASPITSGGKQVQREGEYTVEDDTDLGFGFREVILLVPTQSELAHFAYLYYRDQRLCRLGQGKYSVSPSGEYIIFQDGSTGNLCMYRRADGRRTQLTHFTAEPVPIAVRFKWHEEAGKVDWEYATQTYSIQEAMEQDAVEVQVP